MTEELNQVQDMNSDEEFDNWNLDDVDTPATNEDESIDSSEDVTQTEESEQLDSSEHGSAWELDITYNKESKKLTKEEAIEYAQKGMNYDKILDKYNALKEHESSISELDRLAKLNGLSVSDYLKNLAEVQDSFELNKEIETLKGQYPNADPNLLEEVAKNRLGKTAEVKEESNPREAEISRQMDIFMRRYPNIDINKLASEMPSDMIDMMNNGFTLLEAYESHNADIRAKADADRKKAEEIALQNQKNKSRSLGSTTNSGNVEHDEFLSELFSD